MGMLGNLEISGGTSSGGGGTVVVDGGLSGDGSSGSPLTVNVDNVTIEINGSNQLHVIDVFQTEVDFGALPVYTGTFTVTDANVSATSQIIAQMAYEAATDKDLDETEMDYLDIRCAPGVGQFTMFIDSRDSSYLHDKFKINYTVG